MKKLLLSFICILLATGADAEIKIRNVENNGVKTTIFYFDEESKTENATDSSDSMNPDIPYDARHKVARQEQNSNAAETDIRVTNMRCEPDKVMSYDVFHLYATVENLCENPVDTKIYLCLRSAPDGFWDIICEPFDEYEIHLPAYGKKEIDIERCFVSEDERFEFYFHDASGNLISDYCPLQLGECGSSITELWLPTTEVDIMVGMTGSLLCWVYPGSAPQQVTWEVEDPKIIRIIEYYERGDQGVIYEAIAKGETDITVTAANGMSATCHVTVMDPVRAESITLDKYEITGVIGDTFQIIAHTEPEGNDALVLFNSASEKVATVGLENGLVTITGTGTTEIYAWATPSKGFVQAVCTVTGTTSGVDEIADSSAGNADVYGFDGSLIMRAATPDSIDRLPRGCYILRYPHKTVKIMR